MTAAQLDEECRRAASEGLVVFWDPEEEDFERGEDPGHEGEWADA